MRRFFEMARACTPSILFFDEADPFLDEDNEFNADVISTFKTQLTYGDKMDPKPVVFTIIATNNPLKLPEPVRSRFGGSIVEVGLPDLAARREIIRSSITKMLKVSALARAYDGEG